MNTATRACKPPDPLTEWARHWPFKRASPELIRRVQAEHRKQPYPPAEPAPF